MAGGTILYVCDKDAGSPAVLAALESTGHDVVTTSCTTKAIALLFVMPSAVAVVVDQRMKNQPKFGMPRKLRAIRPDVPIVLLSREHIDRLPPFITDSVSAEQPLEELTSTLRRMLNNDRAVHDRALPDSSRQAA